MSYGSDSGASGGIGLVTVLIALVFLFIWPGTLRYEYRQDKDSRVSVKIDRYSHEIWDYDWQKHAWDKR